MAKQKGLKWEDEIAELEKFFKNAAMLPAGTIMLDACTKITNVKRFVQTGLSVVKTNNGKPAFLPYLNRLQELQKITPHFHIEDGATKPKKTKPRS